MEREAEMKLFLMLCGAFCVLMGFICMFNQRFLEISLRSTAMGNFWKTTFGERFGGVALRLLYGLAQIALGVVLFLFAYWRY
jgi:hypothetical protein